MACHSTCPASPQGHRCLNRQTLGEANQGGRATAAANLEHRACRSVVKRFGRHAVGRRFTGPCGTVTRPTRRRALLRIWRRPCPIFTVALPWQWTTCSMAAGYRRPPKIRMSDPAGRVAEVLSESPGRSWRANSVTRVVAGRSYERIGPADQAGPVSWPALANRPAPSLRPGGRPLSRRSRGHGCLSHWRRRSRRSSSRRWTSQVTGRERRCEIAEAGAAWSMELILKVV